MTTYLRVWGVLNNIIDIIFKLHYSLCIDFVHVFIVLCRWACGDRVVAVLWLLGWCCQTRLILSKCQRVLVPVSKPLSLVHLSLQGNTSLKDHSLARKYISLVIAHWEYLIPQYEIKNSNFTFCNWYWLFRSLSGKQHLLCIIIAI